MSEGIKDSAIKLFGQTIALPLPPADKFVSDASLSQHRHSSFATSTSQDSKDESEDGSTGIIDEYKSKEEKSTSCEIISDGKRDDDKASTLKKPDKIIQCPRCNSMDTKFCYYNNYNVNQPRHFCKNCQRYWTSGGTMRNVPVGSGRRKNKNTLLPNYPHIMVSDTLQADASNGVHLSSLKANAFLISSPGFPVSFYPAALYWGPGPAAPSPPADPSMTVLGKHSRVGKENLDAVLIPKTLRIHDPSEAAKSCKWSTLGIKNEKVGLFKAFESKGDRQSNVDNRAMVLQANPAALCRSLNFHETT